MSEPRPGCRRGATSEAARQHRAAAVDHAPGRVWDSAPGRGRAQWCLRDVPWSEGTGASQAIRRLRIVRKVGGDRDRSRDHRAARLPLNEPDAGDESLRGMRIPAPLPSPRPSDARPKPQKKKAATSAASFVREGGLEPCRSKPKSSTISRSCSDHTGLRRAGSWFRPPSPVYRLKTDSGRSALSPEIERINRRLSGPFVEGCRFGSRRRSRAWRRPARTSAPDRRTLAPCIHAERCDPPRPAGSGVVFPIVSDDRLRRMLRMKLGGWLLGLLLVTATGCSSDAPATPGRRLDPRSSPSARSHPAAIARMAAWS